MRQTLNLGSFFTTGTDEVRQWTIRKGTKAPAAAGVIHGDFEKTFIQAVVYNYDVLKEYGNEADVKAAGKVLTKGKDYEMVSSLWMFYGEKEADPRFFDAVARWRYPPRESWGCEGLSGKYGIWLLGFCCHRLGLKETSIPIS